MSFTTLVYPFASPLYDLSIYLRDLVLRKPLGLTFLPEDLSTEYDSIHLGLIDVESYHLLACLVLKPLDQQVIKMRQVAVHPDFHGKGLGTSLVLHSERTAVALRYTTMELSARETAIDFYSKLAYDTVSDTYMEIGIPHRKMSRALTPR